MLSPVFMATVLISVPLGSICKYIVMLIEVMLIIKIILGMY